MAKAKKFRGSSVKRQNLVEMYGVKDLLNKIEAVGGNVDEACKKAVDNSLALVGYDMQLFMMEHRVTGVTKDSFDTYPAYVDKDGKVIAFTGYDIEKGGLPAIFLDVGTPTQKGHFFRYYAIENHRQEIQQIQQDTLNEILKELKK